jgi:hypothetical protein
MMAENALLSALRTDDYFSQRAARANLPKALKILQRAGAGKPPMTGDGLRAKTGAAMNLPALVTRLLLPPAPSDSARSRNQRANGE